VVSFGGQTFDLKHFSVNETKIELGVLLSLGSQEWYFIDRITGVASVHSFPSWGSYSQAMYHCRSADRRF